MRLRQISFAARKPASPEMVSFGGGSVSIGTDDRSAAYDNERPKHMIELPPFQIDRYPVSNGAVSGIHQRQGIRARGILVRRRQALAGGEWRDGSEALEQSRGRMDDADNGHHAPARSHAPGLSRLLLRGRGVCGVGGKASADGG